MPAMIPHSPKTGLRRLCLEEAAACLAAGGIVVFPTETFYAIGCLADKALACAVVCALKGRREGAPLPLLAADSAQAALAVRLEAAPKELWQRFWPGPLSLLLPALPCLASQARNAQGLSALRVSPHPLAARLAALAGGALTASSANFSGQAPAARANELDAGLLAALARAGEGDLPCGLLAATGQDEEPAGGLPSTLAQPLASAGGFRLRILREGAVSAQALREAGFRLEEQRR